MLSNTLISALRTYVPVIVGGVLAWLALHFGIVVNDQTEAALAVPLTGLLISAYWTGAKLLERKYPQVGVLLGYPAAPNYRKAPTAKKAVKRA